MRSSSPLTDSWPSTSSTGRTESLVSPLTTLPAHHLRSEGPCSALCQPGQVKSPCSPLPPHGGQTMPGWVHSGPALSLRLCNRTGSISKPQKEKQDRLLASRCERHRVLSKWQCSQPWPGHGNTSKVQGCVSITEQTGFGDWPRTTAPL